MNADSFDGLLVVDKPAGMTSRDVVDRAARWFPNRTRLGHTGTLDPLATGVLVLCVGAATRLTEYVQRMPKTYQAGILLGVRSDTDDADGTVQPFEVLKPPERTRLDETLQSLVGTIAQVPPDYSAAKVAGRRAYALARRGEEVALPARQVHVYRIDVHQYEYPRLQIEVNCGKGTYIRSLARDLGEALGCGALVETLRRMRVGPFDVNASIGLDADTDLVRSRLLPLAAAAAELPAVTLPPEALARMRQGMAVSLETGPAEGVEVAVFDAARNLAAIAVSQVGRFLQPVKVLPAVRSL
jgi:tRNA pseudouridine55 synthase